VLVLAVLGVTAAGCIPKSNTASNSGSPTPTSTSSAISPGGQIPTTSTTAVTIDLTQTTQAYNDNYKKAVAEAAKGFSNKVKFCTVLIEFPPSDVANTTQSFYFVSTDTANTSMQSYYFVVQFDLVANKMKRAFMVKKDQTDIACTKLTNDQVKVGYALAYKTAGKKGYFSSFKITDVYKIQMLLQDAGWQITVVDKSGQPTLPLNPIDATKIEEVTGSATPSASGATGTPTTSDTTVPNV